MQRQQYYTVEAVLLRHVRGRRRVRYATLALSTSRQETASALDLLRTHHPDLTMRIRSPQLTPAQVRGILFDWGEQDAHAHAEPRCDYFPDHWREAYLRGYLTAAFPEYC